MILSSSTFGRSFRSRWNDGRKWGARALFAVVDQALISGSNFLLGIKLARQLPADHYGAYALAFSAFSLLLVLDQAIVFEPMSVFGGSRYASSLRRYLGELLHFQGALSILCFGLLLVGAFTAYLDHKSGTTVDALAGIAIATPCILLLYFSRRALYIEYRSATAAAGAVAYGALLYAGVLFLTQSGRLSCFTAFLAMGASALVTSLALLLCTRPKVSRWPRQSALRIAGEHWRYGRWAVASSFLLWVPWNIWFAIIGSYNGLAGTGSLKAAMNFAMPVIQGCAALSLLILPHTSRRAHRDGWTGAKRHATIAGSLLAAGAALYWIVVLLWSKPLLALVYSGRYSDVVSYLPWLALASIASAALVGPASALRGLERPRDVCVVLFAATVAGVGIGLLGTRLWGIEGAMVGTFSTNAAALALAAWALQRVGRKQANVTATAVVAEPVLP